MSRDLEPRPKSTNFRNPEGPGWERKQKRHENHLESSEASVGLKRQNQGQREYWETGFDFIAARTF